MPDLKKIRTIQTSWFANSQSEQLIYVPTIEEGVPWFGRIVDLNIVCNIRKTLRILLTINGQVLTGKLIVDAYTHTFNVMEFLTSKTDVVLAGLSTLGAIVEFPSLLEEGDRLTFLGHAVEEAFIRDFYTVAEFNAILPSYGTHWWGTGKILSGNSFTTGGIYSFQNPPQVNDEVEFTLPFKTGNYIIQIEGDRNVNRGISHLSINGNSIGTLDWYSGSALQNVKQQLPFSIVENGNQTFRVKAATRNPSSANFFLSFSAIRIFPAA